MRKIAIIPARSGSKRIPNKNIFKVHGKPLIQYTIDLALSLQMFDNVYVSTDSIKYRDILSGNEGLDFHMRSEEISGDKSPDIDWVSALVTEKGLREDDALFLLRPTSPLRTKEFVISAWQKFQNCFATYDSLRAVTKVTNHPGKMWTVIDNQLMPLYPFTIDGVPWHSNQTANLPLVFMQTASLEIIWGRTILNLNSLSGNRIMPHICETDDAFDVNVAEDMEFLDFRLQQKMS